MEKLFIAYISTFDLRGNTAATEHVTQTVNGLAAAGINILFLTRSAGNRAFHPNVEVHEFGMENSFFFERRAVAYLRKLARIPQMCYIRDYPRASFLTNYLYKCKIPYVIEHNGLYYIEMKQMPRMAYKLSYFWDRLFCIRRRISRATKNVVVTNAIGKYYSNLFSIPENNFVHIPSGADLQRFSPEPDVHALRQKLEFPAQIAFWFGYIGSMYPWHKLTEVIGAFENVCAKFSHVGLFIGGSGQDLRIVRERIERSPHKDRILLVSPVLIEKSDSYIRAFDCGIGIMEERTAPFCWQVKVNHNAACAVPTLITYTPEFDELFANSVAFASRSSKQSDIAYAMEQIITDTDFAQKKIAARKYVEAELSWKTIIAKTIDVIAPLCK